MTFVIHVFLYIFMSFLTKNTSRKIILYFPLNFFFACSYKNYSFERKNIDV